jgi:23S rRNA (uracil1939-C5)-methyltransferase
VRYVEKKQATLVGFREKNNPRYITDIEQCPVLNARMDAEIKSVRQLLDTMDAPQTIAQIEVAAGDDELALIFRNLEPLSVGDEDKLKDFARRTQFRIFLQPGGPDSVYLFYPEDGREFLSYSLPLQGIRLQFHPTDFTQVNAGLNRLMIEQALSLLALQPDDVVMDLFCGLGNFSLPLAKHAARVIGIEGSVAMVERAQMNASANGLLNTEFYAANLEDESVLSRYTQSGITKMLLDPPRTGALEIVKNIHQLSLDRIVYVSCNPATLARDADILVHEQGFKMVSAGVMDMFPHTAHVESIAVFEKLGESTP